jgi:hypothetical protein
MPWTFNPFTGNLDYYEQPGAAVESDPIFTVSLAANIDAGDITNLGNLSGTNTGDQESSDFDHDALTNTHNLTTDIDHDSITNTHNLTTDISHSTITAGSIDDHADVVITSAIKNQHLIFNGTNWVNAADGTTFTFSCTGFSDGETTTQLIGSGLWRSASTLACTAVYVNGPPTTATIEMSNNGGAYSSVGTMTSPAFTTGTNTLGAINYPAVGDSTLRFRLSSTDGVDSDIDYDTAITFSNYLWYGTLNKNSGITESDIESMTSSLSSSYTTSRALNATSGNYLVIAYPARYTSLSTAGFIFNTVRCPFQAVVTTSTTNTAGYTESYKVYASTNHSLSSSTLQLSTSDTTIDWLYWGELNKASGYTEADVEDNFATQPGKVSSNTISSRSMIVNCTASEYAYIAYPSRLGSITSILISGFESVTDFTVDTSALSITNINGYAENYKVYVSNNPGFTNPTTMTVTI